MRVLAFLLALFLGACREQGGAPAPAPREIKAMNGEAPSGKAPNGALSPSGEKHPGEIVFEDKMEKRTWTEAAADVPPMIAWVRGGGKWTAVVLIKITGNAQRREITKFGPGGEFL